MALVGSGRLQMVPKGKRPPINILHSEGPDFFGTGSWVYDQQLVIRWSCSPPRNHAVTAYVDAKPMRCPVGPQGVCCRYPV